MHFGGPCEVEDGDEVVASFSVFLSPSLAGQTHVLQYPLRSCDRPYEANHIELFCTEGFAKESGKHAKEGSVFKPSSRLTMRCSLDTFGSPNFNSDGSHADTHQSASGTHKYEYTLHSEPFVPKSDYCVAYFLGNEVHLTPVATVQQLYPAHNTEKIGEDSDEAFLGHHNTGAVRVNQRHASGQGPAAMGGMSMTDRFQRELNRQRSTVLNADADTAEQLNFFPMSSPESVKLRQRLVSSTKEPVAGLLAARHAKETPENSLFPPEILVSGGITGGTDKTAKIIRSFASRYSVAEQVAYLMLRCQVLSLAVISDHVVKSSGSLGSTAAVPPAEVVEALRPRAVYMHGVWVSRTCLDFKGMTAALREVILLAFYQSSNARVTRAQLNKMVNSAALRRSIKDILMTISELNEDEPDPTKRCWKLHYVPASPTEYQAQVEAFKKKFPAEEAAQHTAWERRSRPIWSHLGYVNLSRVPPKLALETADSNLPLSSPGAGAGIGGGAGAGAGRAGGPVGTNPSSAEIRDQDLAPIRQYIRALFSEHGVINKMRAKELVLKAREDRYPRATNQMLSAALQGSVQQFTEATWVLSSLGEPTVDRFRPFILQAALELRQFEVVALMRRVSEIVEERLGSVNTGTGGTSTTVPEVVLKRVVKEVADFKSGERLWHLKNGNIATD